MSVEIVTHRVADETLWLLPEKAVYWPAARTLLVADLHLGKVDHFRRAGLAVPLAAGQDNYYRLDRLLACCSDCTDVVLLGDLFHSVHNQDWARFCDWRLRRPALRWTLVRGNHDILTERDYAAAQLEVVPEPWGLGPWWLTHHPLPTGEAPPAGRYGLAGHVHPAVRLRGGGRQTLTLPCFWFGEDRGLLPAFGSFTGFGTVKPRRQDDVFVVTPERVLHV